tara:strand:- start:2993 stop:3469 length:477 start_codon:yes stop_codon:yes gene_type:complete
MSIVDKIKKLNLEENELLTLTYEEGTDVFVHNETEVEDAINETDVISTFASLIADTKLDVRNHWYGNIITHFRDQDWLDDYQRGSFNFEEYLADFLTENFYDQEMIEHSTEKYDHKRGFTTLTAQVQIPVGNFIKVCPFVSGWTISVKTDNGTLTFDG